MNKWNDNMAAFFQSYVLKPKSAELSPVSAQQLWHL